MQESSTGSASHSNATLMHAEIVNIQSMERGSCFHALCRESCVTSGTLSEGKIKLAQPHVTAVVHRQP